ncbi:MAG TPA: tetratricopeptide repeat protein [Saprospiraceae bacterium]|nr:tetratricopeptide repeat protein [Saprospiraceae bacterium]HPN70549.1 tetratricopeptide repeat protein [Saprospiraceae bacterium]
MKVIKKTTTLFILLLMGITPIFAQDVYSEALESAKSLSRQGLYTQADTLLNNLILAYPKANEIVEARAYNFSWSGKHEEALTLFKSLSSKGNDKKYLTGLGFAYMFAGQYNNAVHPFNKVLSQNPNDEEALKGLGYNFYFKGNTEGAEKIFNTLIFQHPENEEYKLALAKIHLKKNEISDSYKLASQLTNSNTQAAEAELVKAQSMEASGSKDLQLWASYSVQEAGKNSYGVRLASFNYNFKNKRSVGLKIDNSLSTDNYALFSRGTIAPTLWLTSSTPIGKQSNLYLEVGNRLMGNGQFFMRSDYVYFTKINLIFKAGITTDLMPNMTEYNGRLGIEGNLTKWLRLGLTYFNSKENVALPHAHRFLGSIHFTFNDKIHTDIGYFKGNTHLLSGENAHFTESVNGGFFLTSIPFNEKMAIILLANYEGTANQSIMIGSLGFRLKFK